MLKATIYAVLGLYVIGFCLMFWMHTQMPVTFVLALARSVLWPVSIIKGDLYPRGERMTVD